MSATALPTVPAQAAESPPEKKSARPLARDERQLLSTEAAAWQPHLELTKLWMRCGPRARREFLADIGAQIITRTEEDP